MKANSYYPVIMTSEVAGTAAFYQSHFRFTPLFASDWYVHLQSREDPSVNLAILDGSHESMPAHARSGSASGLILNFEVDDPDAVYRRLGRRPGCRSTSRCATNPSASATSSPPTPTAC